MGHGISEINLNEAPKFKIQSLCFKGICATEESRETVAVSHNERVMMSSLSPPPTSSLFTKRAMKDIKAYCDKEKEYYWMMTPLNCFPSTFPCKISLRTSTSLALNGVKCAL